MADVADALVAPPDPSFGMRDNPYAQRIARLLTGIAGNVVSLPQRAFGASETMRQGGGYDPGPILEAATLPMGGGMGAPVRMGAGEAALGSGFNYPLYHGSPRADLSMLTESTRGPLGPGVYTSPAEGIAGQYAGQAGKVYQLPEASRDIFRGAGHRTDEEWFGFKDDKARLLGAAESDTRDAISAILDKAWSNDGYPVYQQIKRLYGGHDGAQALYKRAGFQGLSGLVDGPEMVLFGNQPLGMAIK